MSRYKINAQKDGGEWRLFNHDFIAGNRLYRGDAKDRPAWPFPEDNWNHFKTKQAADSAAKKLQAYLEATESEARPKKK